MQHSSGNGIAVYTITSRHRRRRLRDAATETGTCRRLRISVIITAAFIFSYARQRALFLRVTHDVTRRRRCVIARRRLMNQHSGNWKISRSHDISEIRASPGADVQAG